jgi:hypothetical protein
LEQRTESKVELRENKRKEIAVGKSESVERMSVVQLRVHLWSVNQRATEAEESSLLRFVTRKRPVKILQKNSHCGELLPSKD